MEKKTARSWILPLVAACSSLNQRAKCLVRPGTSDNTAELNSGSSEKMTQSRRECVEIHLKSVEYPEQRLNL